MRALPRLSESGAQQNLVGTSLAERRKSAELQLRIARGSGVCDDAIDDSVSPREDIMNWTRSFDDVGMTDVALLAGRMRRLARMRRSPCFRPHCSSYSRR